MAITTRPTIKQAVHPAAAAAVRTARAARTRTVLDTKHTIQQQKQQIQYNTIQQQNKKPKSTE